MPSNNKEVGPDYEKHRLGRIERYIDTDGKIRKALSYGNEDTKLTVWFDLEEVLEAFPNWVIPDPGLYYNGRKFNKEAKRIAKGDKIPGDQPKGIQGKKQNQNQNQNQRQPQNRGRGRGRGSNSNSNSNFNSGRGSGSSRGSGSGHYRGKGRQSQAEWERDYYHWNNQQSGASNSQSDASYSQKRDYREDDYWNETTGPFIRTQDGREYPIYYSTSYNDRRRYKNDRKRERSSSQNRQNRRRNQSPIEESDSETSERNSRDRGKKQNQTDDNEDRRGASYGD